MVLTTIYVVRHGFRGNFTLNPDTGEYRTHLPSPTGIPNDPPLVAHGLEQAQELAVALKDQLEPPINAIYSSPFYRCLQTIKPFIQSLQSTPSLAGVKAFIDPGVGEWYGRARFHHPRPAPYGVLQKLFPWLSPELHSTILPSTAGESIEELHDRIAKALSTIISREDHEPGNRAILICTHAATMIAIGRTLTGQAPKDWTEDDFQTFTASISKFVRRSLPDKAALGPSPKINWQGGKGVGGGWDCILNSDCSHLSGGAERGWGFAEAEDLKI